MTICEETHSRGISHILVQSHERASFSLAKPHATLELPMNMHSREPGAFLVRQRIDELYESVGHLEAFKVGFYFLRGDFEKAITDFCISIDKRKIVLPSKINLCKGGFRHTTDVRTHILSRELSSQELTDINKRRDSALRQLSIGVYIKYAIRVRPAEQIDKFGEEETTKSGIKVDLAAVAFWRDIERKKVKKEKGYIAGAEVDISIGVDKLKYSEGATEVTLDNVLDTNVLWEDGLIYKRFQHHVAICEGILTVVHNLCRKTFERSYGIT